MKKTKQSSELLDLVVTDSFPVCTTLGQLLKKIDSSVNWQVTVCNKVLQFIKKNDGFTDEYRPLQKIESKAFDFLAYQAKAIWIATIPDIRGDYLAYKLNEHIKKDLKLNCSVYRMRLPAITEECVLNSILNKKNVSMDSLQRLRHEYSIVLEHAISTNVSKLFAEKFPINIEFGLHTGIILNFINNCNSLHKIRKGAFTSILQLYKDEVLSKNPISVKICKDVKVGRVLSLKDLYVALSGFVSWYGFGTAIQTAYAQGNITYPTDDSCKRTPKMFPIKKVKSSEKKWGVVGIQPSKSETDAVRYITSQALFVQTNPKYRRVYAKYKQDSTEFFLQKFLLINKEEMHRVEGTCVDLGSVKHTLGVEQKDILFYIEHLGFSLKQIPWIIYSLVKAGLIVYTTDTTVTLTSLGKFVLLLIRHNIPILLKDKYVINTLKGLDDIDEKDEVKNYEFMQTRIDKVRVQTEAAYEGMVAPRCSDKCVCGKKFSIVVNNKGVFATCSNNSCSKAGGIFPIDIIDDKIEVKYDQFRKSKGFLKHGSKKSKSKSEN